jgi:hypothetical protein
MENETLVERSDPLFKLYFYRKYVYIYNFFITIH